MNRRLHCVLLGAFSFLVASEGFALAPPPSPVPHPSKPKHSPPTKPAQTGPMGPEEPPFLIHWTRLFGDEKSFGLRVSANIDHKVYALAGKGGSTLLQALVEVKAYMCGNEVPVAKVTALASVSSSGGGYFQARHARVFLAGATSPTWEAEEKPFSKELSVHLSMPETQKTTSPIRCRFDLPFIGNNGPDPTYVPDPKYDYQHRGYAFDVDTDLSISVSVSLEGSLATQPTSSEGGTASLTLSPKISATLISANSSAANVPKFFRYGPWNSDIFEIYPPPSPWAAPGSKGQAGALLDNLALDLLGTSGLTVKNAQATNIAEHVQLKASGDVKPGGLVLSAFVNDPAKKKNSPSFKNCVTKCFGDSWGRDLQLAPFHFGAKDGQEVIANHERVSNPIGFLKSP